jgi:hypothetical protein
MVQGAEIAASTALVVGNVSAGAMVQGAEIAASTALAVGNVSAGTGVQGAKVAASTALAEGLATGAAIARGQELTLSTTLLWGQALTDPRLTPFALRVHLLYLLRDCIGTHHYTGGYQEKAITVGNPSARIAKVEGTQIIVYYPDIMNGLQMVGSYYNKQLWTVIAINYGRGNSPKSESSATKEFYRCIELLRGYLHNYTMTYLPVNTQYSSLEQVRFTFIHHESFPAL